MTVKTDFNIPTTGKGENAVVYARFSSRNQQEQSIEGQIAAAKTYAAAKGYTIIHEYVDRAVSGRTDNRDDFQQMLSDCAKHQFTVIIVWKVDRFGRNREEITFNKYRAKKHGVRVEYVAENLPDSPEGVILESVLEGMAEYYSLQLSQNVKRGLRENAKKGIYAGGTIPLGYKRGSDKKLEIDPKPAQTVRMIFDEYLQGYTCAEITQHLNDLGLRTSSGAPFNKNSLRTILKNEKYAGVLEFKSAGIRHENGIPAIVSREEFDRVQELMKLNSKAPAYKWTKTEYLLSDKLFCGNCGSPMAGESGRSHTGAKHSYYLCSGHKKKTGCHKRAIRQDFLEDLVISRTREILMDDDLLDFIIEKTWAYYEANDQESVKKAAVEQQLETVNKSILNLVRAIEAGIFNEATKARMDELDAQKTALEAALADFELGQIPRLTKSILTGYLHEMRNLDLTDRECQKRLIRVFVNSIFVYDDHLILNYNFSNYTVTITFDEMQSAASEPGGGFDCCAEIPALLRAAEPCGVRWFANVISVRIALPDR